MLTLRCYVFPALLKGYWYLLSPCKTEVCMVILEQFADIFTFRLSQLNSYL